VDLHNHGRLTQSELINYLSDKYEWLNTDILRALFGEMQWDDSQSVSKYACGDAGKSS
jgi:hypothetical protein